MISPITSQTLRMRIEIRRAYDRTRVQASLLMVRSPATRGVSNHEARVLAARENGEH